MKFTSSVRATVLAALLLVLAAVPVFAQSGSSSPTPRSSGAPTTVRIAGIVRDEANAIALPGIPVEIADTRQTVYTDVDGRYVVDVPPGDHELTVSMEGYQRKTIKVTAGDQKNIVLDVALTMTRFAESVEVTGRLLDVPTSTAEAQLIERKQAQVITDNLGAQEMKQNGDSDAASAMARVTGLSVVDNQYVFVRGLGERYSNTTLSGSVLPTTEPDKKVVPLDLFPSGLIDSVQVAKSYTPDKSSEFAGGLVQIVPLKFPSRPTVDLSYGINYYSNATGKSIPLSPRGDRDWLGFDDGARALPGGFPGNKIVRSGVFTPDVGYSPDQITQFGKQLAGGDWRPQLADGAPGQNWGAVFGNRFGKLGVVASVSQSYKEQAVNEQRQFFHVAEGTGSNVELEALSNYAMQFGTQKAQLGALGNVAYQFTTNHRLSVENFYTHSGRDEGRVFEGYNLDNNRVYRNFRLQFIEEELNANAVGGEHFFQGLSNSRLDWRVSSARASRDEPGLRESLYEYTPPAPGAPAPPFVLADESQAGFQMFNRLNDETLDMNANWSTFRTVGRPTQFKFGVSYVDRTRDFVSRRFRFIPITLTKDGSLLFNNQLTPEELYTVNNVGTAFRFNEETRPTDAYDGAQTTTSGYGMVDVALSAGSRLVAGARVEQFNQEVDTFDPFGLFVRKLTAENKNTDVFPAVNFVQTVRNNSNIRLSYSTTVNRPEFRELAAFEFTDVIGNRAVRGNPELKRALIQNVDGRWEMFTGGRGVLAASVFYKYFDQPIESVVLGAAQPIGTFQNSDHARNVGLEFEAARQIGKHFFFNANYTFVDSRITLLPEQTTTQTSLERALVGQSKNLFNVTAQGTVRGFSTRLLFNYFGDRISEAGANEAPDIIEQGRGALDVVFSQRVRGLIARLAIENLADADYRFTQGGQPERLFKLGRTVAFSFTYSLF
jgi:hypothetical protein